MAATVTYLCQLLLTLDISASYVLHFSEMQIKVRVNGRYPDPMKPLLEQISQSGLSAAPSVPGMGITKTYFP